jgi:hypothetical protein
MALTVKENGNGDFTPIPEGMYMAHCYGLYDLGTQHNEMFNKDARQVLFCFELPEVRFDLEKDGETRNLPKAISKKYTLSLNAKATLRKELELWRGRRFSAEELKGFDLVKVLGAPCQLQVLHTEKDGKTYANIASICPAPKGYMPKLENPKRYFSFEEHSDDGTVMDIPEGTPEWIGKLIMAAKEYGAGNGDEKKDSETIPDWIENESAPPPVEDDVPF